MTEQPVLCNGEIFNANSSALFANIKITDNILLRPFQIKDAKTVQRLAGDKDVAMMTSNIPHPYEDGVAEQWISTRKALWEDKQAVVYAIVLKNEDMLIGCVSLTQIDWQKHDANLGYWLGKPYWNNGYTTQAAALLIRFAFEKMNLKRIYAKHLVKNPASGRVMQKLGMRYVETDVEQIGFMTKPLPFKLYELMH